MKIEGMAWHVWYNELIGYLYDYEDMVKFIQTLPKNEIKTRLKLMKLIKGDLPDEVIKAGNEYFQNISEKLEKARKRYITAEGDTINEAEKDYHNMREAYYESGKKFNDTLERHKIEIEKLHKEECGCEEWNGKELIFPLNSN